MDLVGSKPSLAKDHPEPLIYLPPSSVAIFPDYIVHYSKQKSKNLPSQPTLPTLNDL